MTTIADLVTLFNQVLTELKAVTAELKTVKRDAKEAKEASQALAANAGLHSRKDYKTAKSAGKPTKAKSDKQVAAADLFKQVTAIVSAALEVRKAAGEADLKRKQVTGDVNAEIKETAAELGITRAEAIAIVKAKYGDAPAAAPSAAKPKAAKVVAAAPKSAAKTKAPPADDGEAAGPASAKKPRKAVVA